MIQRSFITIDDVNFADKHVLIRLDLNSRYNKKDGSIVDNPRLESAAKTLKELMDKKAKIVVLAHQSRPGKADFTSMRRHAQILSEKLHTDVRYYDNIFGKDIQAAIDALKSGEMMLVQNVRFSSEEILTLSPEEHAKSHLIRKLEPHVNYYINDAFSVSHRSHASVMGFTGIPNIAGRLFLKEVQAIDQLRDKEKEDGKTVLILGGVKVDDYFGIIERFLQEHRVDTILVGGFMADLGLLARGFELGKETEKLKKKDATTGMAPIDLLDNAKRFFEGHSDKFELPIDVAVDKDGTRHEIETKELPTDYEIKDIGSKTVEKYRNIIESADRVFLKGPMGLYEDEQFAHGSREIVRAVAKANAYSLAGGGDTAAVVQQFASADDFSHTSLAGGATLYMLEHGSMPGIERLEQSYDAFKDSLN
jgi:phosphoglycerate kinase